MESSLVVLPLSVGFGIALQRNLDVRLTLVPGFRIINPGARPRCGCLSNSRRGAEVQGWPASRVLVQIMQSTARHHPRALNGGRAVAPSSPSSSASALQVASVKAIRLKMAARAAVLVPDGQGRVTGQG